MKRMSFLLLTVGVLALAGCGQSRVSKSNGYGSTGSYEQCESDPYVCTQVGVVE